MRWPTLTASLCLASPAIAQQTLLIRLPTEVASPRAIGLGGALVGLGGDVSAFASNPASLVAVPRSLDVTVAGGGKGACTLGAAIHPLNTAAVGLLLPCPGLPTTDHRLALIPATPDGAETLRPKDGRWFGIGGAWTPDRHLALGGLFQLETLKLLGDSGRSRWNSWIGWSVGVFIQPDSPEGTRVGFAYRRGTDRPITGDDAGTLEAPATTRRVRRPDVYSFGVSWRYAWLRNTRIAVSVQPDLIRYPEILPTAAGNELDLRAGVEVWFPFGHCVSGCGGMWQARAGLISRGAIPTFAPRSVHGYDPGRRSTNWAAGVSLAPELGGGKFKVDVSYSHESCSWLGGLAYHFPGAFRGDLEHHRSRP